MSPLEGYKGPENTNDLNGKQDLPQSFESETVKKEQKLKDTKDVFDADKQNVINDIQLNNKIDETIDTLDEQLGKTLSEQEKNELNMLLLDGSKKSSSPKIFVDKILSNLKEFGTEITTDIFNEMILVTLNDEKTSGELEKKARQEEEKIKQQEEEAKQKEEEENQEKEKARIAKETEEYDMNLRDKEGKLKNLKVSMSSLKSDDKNYGYIKKDILNLIDNPPKDKLEYDKKYDEIINQLKTDENALFHISKDLQEQDKKNGTKTFEQFSSNLIQMDADFIPIFDNINNLPAKQMIALGIDNVGDIDISNNVLSKETDDGFEIEAGADGRKLLIEGSKYKLGSKLNNMGNMKEIMAIEKSIKEELSGLNKELKSVWSILKYIGKAIADNLELEKVKKTIMVSNPDLYNELNIGTAGSLVDIQKSFSGLYSKKEEEKEIILKVKKAQIEKIISRNSMEAKELDESKKNTLKYINQICFDLFPQSLMEQLIKEFKTSSMIIPLPGGKILNKETMDLENGMFGEQLIAAGGDMMKINLVMFMEKAIYGEIGSNESIFKNKNFLVGARINPLDFNGAIEAQKKKGNVIFSDGSWNINALRNNLRKEIKVEDNAKEKGINKEKKNKIK